MLSHAGAPSQRHTDHVSILSSQNPHAHEERLSKPPFFIVPSRKEYLLLTWPSRAQSAAACLARHMPRAEKKNEKLKNVIHIT
jgi:hypothetical protein